MELGIFELKCRQCGKKLGHFPVVTKPYIDNLCPECLPRSNDQAGGSEAYGRIAIMVAGYGFDVPPIEAVEELHKTLTKKGRRVPQEDPRWLEYYNMILTIRVFQQECTIEEMKRKVAKAKSVLG